MNRFLVNPSAGKGRSRRSLDLLRKLANESNSELRVSSSADDLVEQARRAAEDGIERLLVVGGDGTFHHVSQGLAHSTCALGVIPAGRGNDFASDLGVPLDIGSAVQAALLGSIVKIDLGRVNDRYFTGYCGVGFDSLATHYAYNAPRLFKGTLAYIYGFLRALLVFEPPVLRVDREGEAFEERAMFAVVCNISRFGGGMRIAPEARFDDGVLNLVLATKLTRLQILRVFPKVFTGQHVNHPAVQTSHLRSARIEVDRPLMMACDGEPIGRLASGGLTVTVEPGALRVVSPP